MSPTFQQLVAQARDWLGADVAEATVANVILTTIRSLGLEVADSGEVYSPAPAPASSWEAPPRQRNVRWSGQGRRRR